MYSVSDQERIELIRQAEKDKNLIKTIQLREEWCWKEMGRLWVERELYPKQKNKIDLELQDWKEKQHKYHAQWSVLAIEEEYRKRQPALFKMVPKF